MRQRAPVLPRVRPAEASREVVDTSVGVCAFTELRWQGARAALKSMLAQRPEPARVQLIVDHNADLAARARREPVGESLPESGDSPGHLGARSPGLGVAAQLIAGRGGCDGAVC